MRAWYSCFGREIIVPAVIAAVAIAQALSSASATTPRQDTVAQVRDSIQLLYNRFDESYVRGDFEDIQALALPNARYVDEREGIDKPFVSQLEFWKSVRAGGTNFTFQPGIYFGHSVRQQGCGGNCAKESSAFG